MIKYILIIFIVLFSVKAMAVPLLSSINYQLPAPPKAENVLALYGYLYTIYQRWMDVPITTQEPNGNVTGSMGSLIIYNNSGTYYLAIQTASPSGTSWVGVKLGGI